MKKILFGSLALLVCACSSNPIIEADKIKVTRDEPGKGCRFLSDVSGKTLSVTGTSEDALKDMKKDGSLKGANYILNPESFGAPGHFRSRQSLLLRVVAICTTCFGLNFATSLSRGYLCLFVMLSICSISLSISCLFFLYTT